MQGELHALWQVLEDAPLGAYLFRAAAGDFFLEAVNAAARQRNPGLLRLLGRPCSLLYRSTARLLQSMGYRVLIAVDGADALALARGAQSSTKRQSQVVVTRSTKARTLAESSREVR
jgi:hypothetical protein